MLRSILEANVLSAECQVDIVFSKWDIVSDALKQPGANRLHEYIAQTRESLNSTMKVGEGPRFFEVAARPVSPTLPFAHGVATLLRAWLARSSGTRFCRLYVPRAEGSSRESSRFASSVASSQDLEHHFDVWQD
jgi:hypothetical protein